MRLVRPLAAAACLVVAGCGTLRAGGAGPKPDPGQPTYRIWHSDGTWHVRAAPGGAAHRFQGALFGMTGGLRDPVVSLPRLRERVARIGNSVQFDFETDAQQEAGLDVASTGGCLRFDLYVDGRRRADRVRFGPRGLVPDRLPATSCP